MADFLVGISWLLFGYVALKGIANHPRFRWVSILLFLVGVGLAAEPVGLPEPVRHVGSAMVVAGALWFLNRYIAEVITDIVLWAVVVTLEEGEKERRRQEIVSLLEQLKESLARKGEEG